MVVYGEKTLAVCPAQAGVIPKGVSCIAFKVGVPRASGGDPSMDLKRISLMTCAPRKRG